MHSVARASLLNGITRLNQLMSPLSLKVKPDPNSRLQSNSRTAPTPLVEPVSPSKMHYHQFYPKYSSVLKRLYSTPSQIDTSMHLSADQQLTRIQKLFHSLIMHTVLYHFAEHHPDLKDGVRIPCSQYSLPPFRSTGFTNFGAPLFISDFPDLLHTSFTHFTSYHSHLIILPFSLQLVARLSHHARLTLAFPASRS